jgi:hypothetical protein
MAAIKAPHPLARPSCLLREYSVQVSVDDLGWVDHDDDPSEHYLRVRVPGRERPVNLSLRVWCDRNPHLVLFGLEVDDSPHVAGMWSWSGCLLIIFLFFVL